MANVTLVIDDELLKEARLKAVREGTSLNAVLRELLGRYVHGAPRNQVSAVEALFELAPAPQAPSKRRWSRSELYDL